MRYIHIFLLRFILFYCYFKCTFLSLAVIELLFGSVLKVGFYIMKWNVIYKCV